MAALLRLTYANYLADALMMPRPFRLLPMAARLAVEMPVKIESTWNAQPLVDDGHIYSMLLDIELPATMPHCCGLSAMLQWNILKCVLDSCTPLKFLVRM